jgi:hypothetical protein
MSPSRRKGATYRPKRDRREVMTAVLTGVAIIVFTAVMVWVLGPHDSGSDSSPTTTTVPAAATTTAPAAPDATTTAPAPGG